MGWDSRGYYYRSRRVSGRVVREYVGAGEVARLAARLDALDREQQEWQRQAERAQVAELDALDLPVRDLEELTDLLLQAALLAAGYRQHKRGEWRKRREQKPE